MPGKLKKRITLTLQHYEIRGVADVTMWGGANGAVEMKPFKVASPDPELIKAGLNDNGFGVQSINGAVCGVYGVYSNPDGVTAKVHDDVITVGEVSEHTESVYYIG